MRFIDSVSKWTGEYIGLVVLIIVGALCYEVVARYLFTAPTIWAHETSTFVFGGMFILGGAYTLLRGGHVNMDLVYNRLGSRTQAIVYMVGSMFFFIFCVVLLWKSIGMAQESVHVREYSAITTWRPPVYPLKVLIPVGVFLLLLQGAAQFIRAVGVALGKKESL